MPIMRTIFVSVILLSLCSLSFSERFAVPLPPQTEITDKKTQEIDNTTITTQRYRSQASQEEIVNFYRNNLTAQGWQEDSGSFSSHGDSQHTYVFSKDVMNILTVGFFPSKESDTVIYFTSLQELNKFPLWSKEYFTAPKSLDFMPVHPGATQFTYNTQFPPMVGITYLIPGNINQVIAFYEKEMKTFGWQLTGKQPNQGRYKFSDWLAIVDPFTKAIPLLRSHGFDVLVPPLDMKGETLKFIQGKKTCTLTIYQFPGIFAASKGTVFDMWMVEKYGDILVCVYYFYE